VSEITRDDGLTDEEGVVEEGVVEDALCEAANSYFRLPRTARNARSFTAAMDGRTRRTTDRESLPERALALVREGSIERVPDARVYSIPDDDVVRVVVISDGVAPRCDCGDLSPCEHVLAAIVFEQEARLGVVSKDAGAVAFAHYSREMMLAANVTAVLDNDD
jgi:hypothetical protein